MISSPTLYFNLRSPYSWLALEDISVRYPELAGAVRWRPFWDPDHRSITALERAGGKFAYTQMSREKHFYILQDVRRLAADRGLTVIWPIDRAPRWEVPHLACIAAKSSGKMPELAFALSRARWVCGKDICDRDTVIEVANSLGLDGAKLAAMGGDPQLDDRGIHMLLAAYRDGVFGVPFFVNGRTRFWGVERLDAFVSHLQQKDVVDLAPPLVHDRSPVSITPASDPGHAGGCG